MKRLIFIVITISVLITGCLNSNSGNSGNLNASQNLQSNAKSSDQIPINNTVNWNPALFHPYGFPKTINSIASDNIGNIVAVGLYSEIARELTGSNKIQKLLVMKARAIYLV